MFCSHFYDAVLPFVLTQIAQPLHEDIINITLSIVILRTTPPPVWFLSCTNLPDWALSFFFLYKFLLFSFIITPDFWSCRPHFYCLSSKETTGASWSQLWKERKESHHPLKYWKEITDDRESESKYFGFLFLLTGYYTL